MSVRRIAIFDFTAFFVTFVFFCVANERINTFCGVLD
jgi:hypothetical protein